MKRTLWILIALSLLTLVGCKEDDTIDCTGYWQLYAPLTDEHLTGTDIERALQQTSFGDY